MLKPLALLLPLLCAACGEYEPPPVEERRAGQLQVGAAEGFLDLPVGAPLGGYTARCWILGGFGRVDGRESDYTVGFSPSAGVQTRPSVKAFWFENGQEDLVLLKIDTIYSFDGFLPELESRLEAATGQRLQGRVMVAANHTHSGFANFSAQPTFFLGGDTYDHEIFTRLVGSMEEAALAAWSERRPARVGVGFLRNWDPDNQVYRDRRGENNELQVFDDIPPGSWKDPELWMLRVDDLDGAPVAALHGFGIHGITLGADNPLASVEAPGHIDLALQERLEPGVVVAHFQGAGGDASPAGEQDGFARLESVGERAADALVDLWDRIPVGDAVTAMETRTRAIRQTASDTRVTRDGSVDWSYLPYDPTYQPDLKVYGEDGEILSPLDEFQALYGAAFCGDEAPILPLEPMGVDVYPYSSCVLVDGLPPLLATAFGIEEEDIPLPLQESVWTTISASLLEEVSILQADGTVTSGPFLMGFFPGETTAYYVEMVRRRAAAELGMPHMAVVGYAQDHEGYLLLTEDWLAGGYEPQINLWGPLQGDHIMDQWFLMAQDLLTPEIEPQVPLGMLVPPSWGPFDLPERSPDPTPDAGTALREPPDSLYSPLISRSERDDGVRPDLTVPESVPRVQGMVELAWLGGDPAVDTPRVVLERQEGGAWAEVLTPSGRPVTDALPDILLAWTPDPLTPSTDEQVHYWWAGWQAMGAPGERAALPAGTYRLKVDGQRHVSGSSWPYERAPYDLTSDAFDVEPARLELDRDGDDLLVSLFGPERGWRFVAAGGSAQGANPVSGELELWFTMDEGDEELVLAADPEVSGGWSRYVGVIPAGATKVVAWDQHENSGSLELDAEVEP